MKRIYFRRGTIIFAIQQSSVGFRILCYFSNTIHHSAQCFGTTPDIKLVKKYKNELMEETEFINAQKEYLLKTI